MENLAQVDGVHPHFGTGGALLVKVDDALVCDDDHIPYQLEAGGDGLPVHQIRAVLLHERFGGHLAQVAHQTGSQLAA